MIKMADGFLVYIISFIFLMATICIEIISFLTTHMLDSLFDPNLHEGLFRKCEVTKFGMVYYVCVWRNLSLMPTEMQHYKNNTNNNNIDWIHIGFSTSFILALISCGLLAIVFFLNILSFINFFKVRCFYVTMGVLMILNGKI